MRLWRELIVRLRAVMQGIMAKKKPYDCSKCPGYCCSYHIIPVSEKDLKRLADYFGLGIEAAKK